jgi:hypothetical protein
MDECAAAGIRQAITTTTSRSNADALFSACFGRGWAGRFAAVLCGEDVQRKKPDPEVYLHALAALKVGPLDVVAVEDSPGGVAAARAADVPVLVTLSSYFADATIEGAIILRVIHWIFALTFPLHPLRFDHRHYPRQLGGGPGGVGGLQGVDRWVALRKRQRHVTPPAPSGIAYRRITHHQPERNRARLHPATH